MPMSEGFPFKRVMVTHLFHGLTRIWWEVDPTFTDEGPYTFQLQASYTGNPNALDWADIGDPVVNPQYLEDDTTREHTGMRLLTHYRVVVTSTRSTYVSQPAWLWGVLEKRDWLLAREMLRKERLRLGLVSQEGYLVRKMRYGVKDPNATDFLTDEVLDSGNLTSWGTAFKVGYHPPVRFSVDMDGEIIAETRGGADISKHSNRQTSFKARVIAFPDVAKEDFWVDQDNDQRWVIHDIRSVASWRGVPLVNEIELRLAPHTDVIYKIPVNTDAYDPGDLSDANQPEVGDGCVRVDHDYPEDENLTYVNGDCCPIEGATILIFTKEDYDGGARTEANAVAKSMTTHGGRWAYAVKLDPGEYVLVFEKLGEWGPDTVNLTVQPPDPGPPPSVSSSVSSGSSVSDSFGSF